MILLEAFNNNTLSLKKDSLSMMNSMVHLVEEFIWTDKAQLVGFKVMVDTCMDMEKNRKEKTLLKLDFLNIISWNKVSLTIKTNKEMENNYKLQHIFQK